MIEIRTFEGDPHELATFVATVWRKRYEGRMLMPLWSGKFLEWELLTADHEQRQFIVAAYDGSKLVGVLPARPEKYHLRGRPVRGTRGSYFGVDPAYENEGVSLKLNLEQRRRHREQGADVFMGQVYVGSSASMGKEFWLRQRTLKVIGKMGMSVRLIDHRAMYDFQYSLRDRWASRFFGLFQGAPKPPRDTSGVRPFRREDLADCLRLEQELTRAADWSYDWNETSLGRQLDYRDVPQTLVATLENRVAGFINWWYLDLLGRREVTAAVIDFLTIQALPRALQKKLLQCALSQMTEAGCQMAFVLRMPAFSQYALHMAGFIIQPAEYYYVAQSLDQDLFATPIRRLHVHWR